MEEAKVKVSKKLIVALKLSEVPAYRVAQRAGLHPAVLSRLIHGADRVRDGDPRVLAIADVLGVSAEDAFEREPAE